MKEPGNRSHFTPEGWHTLTPRIVIHDAKRAIRHALWGPSLYGGDEWGNTWQIATHIGDRDADE